MIQTVILIFYLNDKMWSQFMDNINYNDEKEKVIVNWEKYDEFYTFIQTSLQNNQIKNIYIKYLTHTGSQTYNKNILNIY